ncbi:MAG TPA: hypothetical protein VMJ66_04365 [Geobacteraceae bacterium]|nr:hypothetical protein [Geobacteraceae bacterium]
MVTPEDADRAKQIIADFLGSEMPEEKEITTHYSLGQIIRMILESLIFYCIPGKKKRKRMEQE